MFEISLNEDAITHILLKDGKWYEVNKAMPSPNINSCEFGYYDVEELGGMWHTRAYLTNENYDDINAQDDLYMKFYLKDTITHQDISIVTKLDNVMAFQCGNKREGHHSNGQIKGK
jgi:hypothetical protein